MKIVVIANCQVQPIARGLMAIPDVEEVLTIPIHLYGTHFFEKYQQDYEKKSGENDLVILTFVSGDDFGEFATEKLKIQYPNILRMTNIHFSGLHPDITYLGDRLGRIQSPIGDYHSKLVIYGYITGKSVSECMALFNAKEYQRHDYFSEFGRSSAELLSRDEELEIKFARPFLDGLRYHLPLYTINHPTGFVFQEYVNFIAKYLSLAEHRFPLAMLPNFLANSAWWPVFPEIGEEHRLDYHTPMVFRQPDHIGGKNFDLEQFVSLSYRIYSDNSDRIQHTRQAQQLIDKFK